MTGVRRGLAAPCFAEDPAELVELGVRAEEAGFDGFFLWDHLVFSNDGDGPPIVDPWLVLAVIASRTSRIRLGPMITPVSRRRPWVLARQTATLDVLSGGRTVLGIGLGSPAHGDFGIFGDATDPVVRAELLDEGMDVVAGLWTGDWFSHQGKHFTVEPVRFRPRPAQRPRIPVWVGGVLPAQRPMRRAAGWDGAVPIRFAERELARVSVADVAGVRELVHDRRGSVAGYDIVVWAEVAAEPAAMGPTLASYADAGATWWIETAKPGAGWQDGLRDRIAHGV
ncbi:LLM class flavin-dependent oxidoreductase [Nakamurella deserti]|uniref:LLM class flavin-dependent oxidoreductase n=1 Tax=Nakamurella deserti TaxID=2164074 RepID=UPI0014797AB8|nr:LLM class flavin-dependent oxidoreductase [Nakamurella deserti]